MEYKKFALTPEQLVKLNAMNKDTIMEQLGINFLGAPDGFLRAEMPVDHRTHQPFGLLHGGASCVLAETLGSTASYLFIDDIRQFAVGLQISANHVQAARRGKVIGEARPVHIGRTTHVWDIPITNEEGRLICASRLTMAVREKPKS